MGSLGHSRAFGQLLKVRVHGILAWLVRRTYYLLQMPGWTRQLRIMIDWTFALLFRPDIVKISLDTEAVSLLREAAAGAVSEDGRTEAGSRPGATSTAAVSAPRTTAGGA
jgi:NADH dehydrogenase